MTEISNYSQKVIKEYADEHPDYFLCSRRHVIQLKEKAEAEKREVLKDFFVYYRGDIDIRIEEREHPTGWSIAATMVINGKDYKTEDPCTLMFIELNELVLKRMIDMRKEAK